MAKPKVTLKDIAAKTGYGTNTVSLALRGSTRISAAARQLIRDSARELGYIPNAIAKSLVSRKSNTIGLILHEITNPIVTSAAKMIQLALASRGYDVLFATSNGKFEEELHAIEMFRSRMVDGILVYPLMHSQLDHLKLLREQNFPVVLLIGVENAGIDAVGIDEFKGAYAATRHLIDLGHRRIAAIVNTRQTAPEKFRGYVAALDDAGIPVEQSLIYSPGYHAVAAGIEGMAALMAEPRRPTAVFGSSDLNAFGALRWAKMNGVSVPDELAIIGFDDVETAQYAMTSLSTINNDVGTLARLSVERLLELVECAGPLPAPRATMLEGALVIRESTAPPRTMLELVAAADKPPAPKRRARAKLEP